jgi:predicted metal-dependent phosphoesterase TrpH
MIRPAVFALFAVALAAGTLADRPLAQPPLLIGGYRVLAGDFHVHSAVFSAGALAPWDLVLEARRQGLDVFAITPHNQVWTGRLGRWASRVLGGPRVLAGEEVRGPAYHLIALGIERRVGWDQPATDAIDEVHRQGGVAIAAHPVADYWPAYDESAMRKLDGSEVLHPAAYLRRRARAEMEQFHSRRVMTAVGSSDYHGLGRLGLCRTYVFAKDDGEPAILDALRAGRTVVYDRDGRVYGDPKLARLAAADGRLRARQARAEAGPDRSALFAASRLGAIAALLAVFAFGLPSTRHATGR